MRNATPLIIAPSLPPLENRVEVLIARARLQMPFLPDMDQVSDPLTTILVSFDPSEAARRSVRMLAASFIAAEPSISQAPTGTAVSSWLVDTLQQLDASSMGMVIALPEHSPDVEQQLLALLEDGLRPGHRYLSLVVGVTTTPADWARCALDGLVLAEKGQRDFDALQMFSALAAVMAPGLMYPLDADDFRCALGNAENPSQIVEATFRLDDHRLVPASVRAAALLGRCAGVVVMACRCLRLTSQSRLLDRIRESTNAGAAITVVAPWGLTVEHLGSPDIVRIFLLCRNDPEADQSS